MSKGILVFARNNEQVDYVKQAYHLAKRAKEYLNLLNKHRGWHNRFPEVFPILKDIV